jgi:hypothetical protein
LLLNHLFITIRFSYFPKDVGSVEKGSDKAVKRVYLQLYSSCDQPPLVFWKNAHLGGPLALGKSSLAVTALPTIPFV